MTAVLLITLLLFVCYAGLLLFYRQSWLAIPSFKSSQRSPITKISVIIPARNEEKNIGDCLYSITNQSYPKELVEIIVVDDHSTDKTAEIITSYASQKVKLISLKDHVTGQLNSYKKKAIEIAVQQSTGDLIVTTDADCIVPENWLNTIATFYEEHEAAFIAAPVSIDCSSRFIELFQALDFMTLQGITGASVHKRFHTMCNGANLAYKKSAFYEVNGFAGIDSIASGDDMLLMHKIYERYPEKVLFLKSKEVIVQTQPVHSISQFFNQRIRWASKADKYDDKRMLPVLLLVYLFNVLLLAFPIMALFSNSVFIIIHYQLSIINCFFLLLLLKIIVELLFLFPVAKFFGKQKLLWLFPLFQPFHIIYTVIAGFLGKFGSYKWKERKVK
jgi:cellulose synthase/poly-beta-1,6-N-acetylglucosamine synthase-like glycosyltransferase